jgi:catechol 2,3-dioxygenase-like lactoylglutathione lyase family enzyme
MAALPGTATPRREQTAEGDRIKNGRTGREVAHLERHGVEVEIGPVERPGASGTGRSVYFRDPDGSPLELIAYR